MADGGEQLLFVLERLLSNSVEREKLGENAHRVVASLRGSTDRHLDWIADFLQAGYQPVKG